MGALTDKGFLRPTYQEILNKRIELAKKLFGEDINTDEKTAMGKFIRFTAYDLATAYEDMELIYLSLSPDTATGKALDSVCGLAQITRNPAARASYVVTFIGDPSTLIPAGFLVSTVDNITFYTMEDLRLNVNGTGTVEVRCTEAGAIGNVDPLDIVAIVNPTIGVEAVNCIEQKVIGEDEESDTSFRKRFKASFKGLGSGTKDAIVGAVMRVDGVKDCILVENDTEETDEAGRLPHSFETYVLAPEEQAQVIAEAIFSKKPVGIKTVGGVENRVLDRGGYPHVVKFSWVREKNIFVKLKVLKNKNFSESGEEEIKENLSNKIGELVCGGTVILSTLYSCIHSVSGVGAVETLQLSVDGATYNSDNITCSHQEVARLPIGNIVLEVGDFNG